MSTFAVARARERLRSLTAQNQRLTGVLQEAQRIYNDALARENALRERAANLRARLSLFQHRLDAAAPAIAQKTLMGSAGAAARDLRAELREIEARLHEAGP